jgi:hypothetical protein
MPGSQRGWSGLGERAASRLEGRGDEKVEEDSGGACVSSIVSARRGRIEVFF